MTTIGPKKQINPLGVPIRKFTLGEADKLIYMVTARPGWLRNYTSIIKPNKRTIITCRVCLFEKKNVNACISELLDYKSTLGSNGTLILNGNNKRKRKTKQLKYWKRLCMKIETKAAEVSAFGITEANS